MLSLEKRMRLRAVARRRRREGATVRQIAVDLGVSRSAVGSWVLGVEAIRTCRLCDAVFETVQARTEFCCPQHQWKWHRIYGRSAA